MSSNPKSTERFSDTVADYINYRPGYPDALLAFLEERTGWKKSQTIADIGAGTGKLTELLLTTDSKVYAVEPNGPMREAAEQLLGHFPNFESVNGTAEASTLENHTVHLITCAQAFHWFDPVNTRREFQRILHPDGWIAIIWNKRIDEHSDFMLAYHQYLGKYGTDYTDTCLRRIDDKILGTFFRYQRQDFYHFQEFDWQGLKGRYLSCSYAFHREHPQHAEALHVLKELFDRFAENGKVKMWYRTEVYYGKLD